MLTLKKAADPAIGVAMHEFGGSIPRIQIAARAGGMFPLPNESCGPFDPHTSWGQAILAGSAQDWALSAGD